MSGIQLKNGRHEETAKYDPLVEKKQTETDLEITQKLELLDKKHKLISYSS